MMMHTRTQVDEAMRTFNHRGEDVSRERVDRENVRQSVAGHAIRFIVANGSIVDDGIEASQGVDT